MWEGIHNHFKEKLPVWIVGIVLAGISVFGTGLIAWRDYAVAQAELNRKMDLVMCKLEIEDNEQCPWTSTITEDLEKLRDEEEDGI